jgi:hypothetical protein
VFGTLPLDRDLELEARSGSVSRERPFYGEMRRIAEALAAGLERERFLTPRRGVAEQDKSKP